MKTDNNDAVLLARLPREKFRLLTAEELELRIKMWSLINKYEKIARWRKKLKKLVKDCFDYNFREVIGLMEADRWKVSKEIVRQVSSLPIYGETYRKAYEVLGVKNSIELAILILELPLHLPLAGLKGLLGLNPNRTEGRYNRRLRHHIAAFAANLYVRAKKHANIPAEIVDIVNHLPKEVALCKLQLTILKALQIAYLMTVKPLAAGSKCHRGRARFGEASTMEDFHESMDGTGQTPAGFYGYKNPSASPTPFLPSS